MSIRWWALVIFFVLGVPSALLAQAPTAHRPQVGYLVVRVHDAKNASHFQIVPYYPQAGDMLLYDYFNALHTFAFQMVGTGAPVHSGMVFDRQDGSPAILDIAGPRTLTAKVVLPDACPRMMEYKGAILVRRPCRPLTCEQSAALTHFAVAQEGKPFAIARLALQGTPFRPRTCTCFAATHLDRERWICSELVVAAATVAGLVDPHVHFANAILPGDLAYDDHCDLSGYFQEPALWIPDPHPGIHGDRVWTIRDH